MHFLANIWSFLKSIITTKVQIWQFVAGVLLVIFFWLLVKYILKNRNKTLLKKTLPSEKEFQFPIAANVLAKTESDLIKEAEKNVEQHVNDMVNKTKINSLLIAGGWGTGKTTFWNDLLYKNSKTDSLDWQEDFNHIYLETIYYDSADELLEDLIYQIKFIYELEENKVKFFQELLEKLDISINPIRISVKLNKTSKDGLTSKDLINKLKSVIAKPLIITFDDLERWQAKDIPKLLKIIHLLSNINNISVVVISDKKNLIEAIAKSDEIAEPELYLEKIFDSSFNMPSSFNLFQEAFTNLLKEKLTSVKEEKLFKYIFMGYIMGLRENYELDLPKEKYPSFSYDNLENNNFFIRLFNEKMSFIYMNNYFKVFYIYPIYKRHEGMGNNSVGENRLNIQISRTRIKEVSLYNLYLKLVMEYAEETFIRCNFNYRTIEDLVAGDWLLNIYNKFFAEGQDPQVTIDNNPDSLIAFGYLIAQKNFDQSKLNHLLSYVD